MNQGAGLLIAEGGTPQMIKTAYLTDQDCKNIAAQAFIARSARELSDVEVAR
jgi:S-DNA-T family DNA segregation ATPase FtsK/SpoIIIE